MKTERSQHGTSWATRFPMYQPYAFLVGTLQLDLLGMSAWVGLLRNKVVSFDII